jgi:hypothetical protein
MPNLKQILSDATAMAEFSNLGLGDVNRFRQKHPDFFPGKWWDYRNGQQWRMTQDFLRQAWEERFAGGFFTQVRLLLSVFDPETTLDAAFGFDVKLGEEQVFANLGDISAGTTPFQRAVLHLFENPWRARFCPVCGKRFVAAEAKTKFCSLPCSDEATRRRHLEWARKNLKAWRRKQKQRQK